MRGAGCATAVSAAYNDRMDAVERVYAFYERYRGEKFVFGRSVCGAPLVALFAGKHEYPLILVQCAIHAREWVTALLALEQIARGMSCGGAYFVPLSNPDGAKLALRGEAFVRTLPPARARLLRRLGGFSLWKANARAVDLNVNFDAGWGRGTRNVFAPAPENYVGTRPFSEPETRALRDLTLRLRPDATVSFHTKGREIYWEYGQCGGAAARDEALAAVLAEETGYAPARAAGSHGGYKDWCVQALGIPSFTVEAGADEREHPLGEDALGEIAAECAGVPARLAEAMRYGR